MSAANKKALIAIVKRCSDVIDGEIRLLGQWASVVTVGRQAQCLAKQSAIQNGSRRTMTRLQTQIAALSAARVTNEPSAYHDWMVTSNEQDVVGRSTWDPNVLRDEEFHRALDRSERNADDSVNDATVIRDDCV